MKYDVVQTSIEQFVQSNWTTTALQFDNVAFNSDLYEEFCRCTVIFGEGRARTVTVGCYRQIGLLMFGVFVKPGIGVVRMNELAEAATKMLTSKRISAVLPLIAPSVVMKVPSLMRDLNEKFGWVMAQVSCPFYYDFQE